jgi:transcription initiation factor IIE alpha subunit
MGRRSATETITELIAALFSREQRTVDELAQQLELTERTVQRRLRELAAARIAEERAVDGQVYWRATRALASKGALISHKLLGDVCWLLERLPRGGERDRVLRSLPQTAGICPTAGAIIGPALDEARVRTLDMLALALRERRVLYVAVQRDSDEHETMLASVWVLDLRAPERVVLWDHRAAAERVLELRSVNALSLAMSVRFVGPSRAGEREESIEFDVLDEDALGALGVDVAVERGRQWLFCRASAQHTERVARFVLQHAPRARTHDPAVIAAIRAIADAAAAPTAMNESELES